MAIDCNHIRTHASVNAAATTAAIEAVQAALKCIFPPSYVALLHCSDGLIAQQNCSSLLLYSTAEIAERNTTYEVAEYLPDLLMIGDDGGGQGIFIAHGHFDSAVYRIGMGSMQFDRQILAANLAEWILNCFALDQQGN